MITIMMIIYAFRETTYVRDVVDKSFIDEDLFVYFYIFGYLYIVSCLSCIYENLSTTTWLAYSVYCLLVGIRGSILTFGISISVYARYLFSHYFSAFQLPANPPMLYYIPHNPNISQGTPQIHSLHSISPDHRPRPYVGFQSSSSSPRLLLLSSSCLSACPFPQEEVLEVRISDHLCGGRSEVIVFCPSE